MTEYIAAIRIRGPTDTPKDIQTTLENLNLDKNNKAVIYKQENDAVKGMLNKAKDYITYGPITEEETLEKLQNKTNEEVTHGTNINLHPPKGGFKNTRKSVKQGGSLGKRKNIDTLLNKMV